MSQHLKPSSSSLKIFFVINFFVFHATVNAQTVPQLAQSQSLISGGITLQADSLGHYKGTVLINKHPFPFVIDTGASVVAIPRKMAYIARLPFGESRPISTANGSLYVHSTRMNTLSIGTANFTDFEAVIMPNLDHVLIGMNVLKYFHINQSLNTLTLVALNHQELALVGGAVPTPTVPAKPLSTLIPRTTWQKTVTCDTDGTHCKTSYR